MQLTSWFRPDRLPVWPGLYMVRVRGSDCWHVGRFEPLTGGWYSAGTTGIRETDLLGGRIHSEYEWRGLTQPA